MPGYNGVSTEYRVVIDGNEPPVWDKLFKYYGKPMGDDFLNYIYHLRERDSPTLANLVRKGLEVTDSVKVVVTHPEAIETNTLVKVIGYALHYGLLDADFQVELPKDDGILVQTLGKYLNARIKEEKSDS